MKRLLILRHAKSSWKEPGLDDHERPLNKRGKRDAPRMGRLLKDEDLLPDLILSSTAARARATAEMVVDASRYKGPLVFTPDLYEAVPQAYVNALRGLDDQVESAMVIGHNPGVQQLLRTLTGTEPTLPTAALAKVELEISTWSELDQSAQGTLVQLWRPKELDND
jgi:phosphohistidine phosphatase